MKQLFLAIVVAMYLSAPAQTLNEPVYLNYSSLPKANIQSSGGSISTQFIELGATLPAIAIGQKIKLFNGFYYRHTDLSFSNTAHPSPGLPSSLTDIRYTAIVRARLNQQWEVVAIPRLMLRSDLKETISSSDLFPQVVLLATYAVGGNPNFKIGLGAALNNDFERNAIVPIGSLYWDGKKTRFEIVYPNAHFLYKYSKTVEFGLFASVDGAIANVQPTPAGYFTGEYFKTFQLLVAPTVSFRIAGQLFGNVKAGFSPLRNYTVLDNSFATIPDHKMSVEPAFFIRTGIAIRLKK